MNVLSLAILGTSVLFLISGLLFGLKRGWIRSLVRLMLIGASAFIAWAVRPMIADYVLKIGVVADGIDSIANELGADPAILVLLAEIVIGVVSFIVAFYALKLVAAIIGSIVCAFLPKGNRLLGMVIGAAQGALIAFLICAPLNGLLLDVNNITKLEFEGEKIVDAETEQTMKDIGIDFDAYKDSEISKLYTMLGGDFYKALSSAQNANGETVTLSGYVEAVGATSKLYSEFAVLSEIDLSGGLTDANSKDIQAIMKNLNQIKGDLSPETAVTVNDAIATVLDAAGEDVPDSVKTVLEGFDIREVDFEAEGQVILDLYSFSAGEGEVTATDLVNGLADTTVLLPVLDEMVSAEEPLEIPQDTEAEVIAAIDAIATTDPAKAETLRAIFGLN